MKRERWGSPLVQEKYQAEKACDKRHPLCIIIIIIVVVVVVIVIIIIKITKTTKSKKHISQAK